MVTTAYLQKVQTVKCRPNLYDDPERRIVVIIHLLKQEGILCTNSLYGYRTWLQKRTHSDGSSPVTTTPLLNHFLVINRFYFHAGISVREDRYTIFIDY